MTSRSLWLLRRVTRRLWVRASAFAVLAIATALVAAVLSPHIPAGLSTRLGAASVSNILEILASSMLVVATFSVATLVSAYASASAATTPRAIELMLEDTQAQNAIATFVGGFLFALVGIIGLSTGAYGDDGRLVLFAVTLAVIAIIVSTFLRWLDLLTHLGQVHDVIERVAGSAVDALARQRAEPFLGGRPRGEDPAPPHAIMAGATGYLQHVDMADLERIAVRIGDTVHIEVLPGAHVDPGQPLARVATPPDADTRRAIGAAFSIGPRRSFEQDPRQALIVLSEIGSKALSPGVNDPGSAVQALDALLRVLAGECVDAPHGGAARHPHVAVPALDAGALIAASFSALARDAGATLEVAIRLQQVLAALHRLGDDAMRAAAREQSDRALAHARARLTLEADIERIDAVASELFAADPPGAPVTPRE